MKLHPEILSAKQKTLLAQLGPVMTNLGFTSPVEPQWLCIYAIGDQSISIGSQPNA